MYKSTKAATTPNSYKTISERYRRLIKSMTQLKRNTKKNNG